MSGKLLHLLLRWAAGERKVWSVVHVPTPAAEAARQLTREIDDGAGGSEAGAQSDPGVAGDARDSRARSTGDFRAARAALQTGDGRPLPAAWRARLAREWAHLAGDRGAPGDVDDGARRADRDTATDRVAAGGAAAVSAARRRGDRVRRCSVRSCSARGRFANGRQLGALTGLVPVPYRSDQRVQDQGISKAGRGELRRRRDSNGVGLGALAAGQCADASGSTRRFAAAGGRSAAHRDCRASRANW